MPIVKTEGIVLKRRDFGETSRVAVIFSENFGKIQVNAKGARKPKSKFGATLEPLTRVEVLYYHRETKELYTLSEATIITSHQSIREHPVKSVYGLAMAETLDRLTQPEEENAGLYRLLGRCLLTLETIENEDIVFLFYLLQIAAATGFMPQLATCDNCGKELPDGQGATKYAVITGGVLCGECAHNGNRFDDLKEETLKLLLNLTRTDYRKLDTLPASAVSIQQGLNLMLTHLRYHAELKLNTLGFMDKKRGM